MNERAVPMEVAAAMHERHGWEAAESGRFYAEKGDPPEQASKDNPPETTGGPVSPADRYAFELEGVRFSYPDGVLGVEIDSLGIRRGVCTILLGANGSGKSTLLKMLDGLLFPERGEVRAFGEPLSEAELEGGERGHLFRSRVGFVFQDADIQCFSPTVREELAFGPLQQGLTEDEVDLRVRNALTALRLESLADRYPYRLSGGEKKRVAIASVLTIDPDVYLLDEPTANLDPSAEGILIDLLGGFSRQGKTLVIATQDLLLARHIGDRAVILGSDRSLAAEGDITELLARTDLLQSTGLAHSHRHPHKMVSSDFRHSHYTEEEPR
jgi:cobalt/nickel transport system ATP-binding protein